MTNYKYFTEFPSIGSCASQSYYSHGTTNAFDYDYINSSVGNNTRKCSNRKEHDVTDKKPSFWEKLGDAILKAIPAVILVVVKGVVEHYFGNKSKTSKNRGAV